MRRPKWSDAPFTLRSLTSEMWNNGKLVHNQKMKLQDPFDYGAEDRRSLQARFASVRCGKKFGESSEGFWPPA